MKLTPLLKQYHAIKAQHKDSILLFRMGDFYEMFYEDAVFGSRVLGIALTSRPHGKGARVPLAGVPYRAVDSYVAKLVKAGYRVAICEQTEDPRLAKTVVQRGVTEVITQGTIMRPSLLDEARNNYLAAIAEGDGRFGLAAADLSTGEFTVTEGEPHQIAEEIRRLEPAELLAPEGEEGAQALSAMPAVGDFLVVTHRPGYQFTYEWARERLVSHFGVVSLDGFGCSDSPLGVAAAGAVLAYLEETQRAALTHITRLSTYSLGDHMLLDRVTRTNLELTRRIREEGAGGTLFWVLNHTATPMGTRLLRKWIVSPITDTGDIGDRQDAVAQLIRSAQLREYFSKHLDEIGDIERQTGRIACRRGSPRDLVALKDSLKEIPGLRARLARCSGLLGGFAEGLGDFQDMVGEVERGIVDDPPQTTGDGGIIRDGYDEQLDELRTSAREGKQWMARLAANEREQTGIASLKVGFNNVFGYYIEVSRANLTKVPERYTRKQTLSNCERFVTQELKEIEERVLGAEEKIRLLEEELFVALRAKVAERTEELLDTARILAHVDVFQSLAQVAVRGNYIRPVVDDGDRIVIREGRHPVVERLIPDGDFVPNDIVLDLESEQILIITGPNMAGKSTYLRQQALLVIMAQMGSFIPAREAKIGVVDRVFTRVGASDDLSRGVSTFLAEMNETANILNNATSRSLVLLDEIGRGTSTFDGLAIAWAVVEYLHADERVKPKTLFATHYHELTELETILDRVRNWNVSVREEGDRVIFLRRVVPGPADRSYGIQVARLAGLPVEVIERASEVLANLEDDAFTEESFPRLARGTHAPSEAGRQLSLFTPGEHPIVEELSELDLEKMTPLQAMQKLDEMRRKYAREGRGQQADRPGVGG
jgi:DNA mismatch repair protein MutS